MTERDINTETRLNQLSAKETIEVSQTFIQYFGIESNPFAQSNEFVDAVSQLDPRYQGGRELVRWELEADQTEWPKDATEMIKVTAESLSMFGETPLKGQFDAVIVLGAARQANLDRLRYAAESIKDGSAVTKRLYMTGSARKLNEGEKQNTANYAPGSETEFDLVVAAAGVVFQENPGLSMSLIYLDNEKASTSDAFEAVFEDLKSKNSLSYATKVAAVTTQIYQ
jgi:hypothetical protein